jgi:hypothetical protein
MQSFPFLLFLLVAWWWLVFWAKTSCWDSEYETHLLCVTDRWINIHLWSDTPLGKVCPKSRKGNKKYSKQWRKERGDGWQGQRPVTNTSDLHEKTECAINLGMTLGRNSMELQFVIWKWHKCISMYWQSFTGFTFL